MNNNGINLFIVDDSLPTLTSLRNYLDTRFGRDLNIFTFLTGSNALKKINKTTGIVILDSNLKKENGNEILRSIKILNPKTKVIMLGSNEQIGIAIDAFKKGATDYVFRGRRTWKKISAMVKNIITYPIRTMGKEFAVSKYMTMFLLTFLAVGVVAYSILYLIK
jgi:DNA-binding NtrC family response regulator